MYELRYTRYEVQSPAPAAQCCKAEPALTQNASAASQTLNSYFVNFNLRGWCIYQPQSVTALKIKA